MEDMVEFNKTNQGHCEVLATDGIHDTQTWRFQNRKRISQICKTIKQRMFTGCSLLNVRTERNFRFKQRRERRHAKRTFVAFFLFLLGREEQTEYRDSTGRRLKE